MTTTAQKYRAIAQYDPVYADEIKLDVGDLVDIVQSYDDGWVLGHNEVTNLRGLLPFNFLAPIQEPIAKDAKPTPAAVVESRPITTTADLPPPLPKKDEDLPGLATLSRLSSFGQTSSNGTADVQSTPYKTPPQSIKEEREKPIQNPDSGVVTDDQRHSQSSQATLSPPTPVNTVNKPNSAPGSTSGSVVSNGEAPRPERALSVNSIVNAVMAAAASRSDQTTARQGVEERAKEAKKKLQQVEASKSARAKSPGNVGVLRIAVAGDSGIGKTSLIRNFLSGPEITAFDPAPTETFATKSFRASTYNHTAPSEVQYNLTFVDTPGFGAQMDAMATIKPVVEYHLQQFEQTDHVFAPDVDSTTLRRFLMAPTGAHTHVDVLIFGILHRLKPVDIEYMKRLAPYVAIVPVILKCDTLTHSELFKLKVSVLEEVKRAGVDIYGFGMNLDELIDLARAGVGGAVPFAVSNPLGRDESELGTSAGQADRLNEFKVLKTCLLSTNVDDIRSITAGKFVAWRQGIVAQTRQRQMEMERQVAEERARQQALAQAHAQAQFDQQQQLYQQSLPNTMGHGTHNKSSGNKILNTLFGRKGSSASTLPTSPSGSFLRARRPSEDTNAGSEKGSFDRGSRKGVFGMGK